MAVAQLRVACPPATRHIFVGDLRGVGYTRLLITGTRRRRRGKKKAFPSQVLAKKKQNSDTDAMGISI